MTDDRAALFGLKQYIEDMRAATNGRQDLIILSGRDAQGHDGVTWLQGKIEQYKPDVCFVDGLYLMNDDRGNKKQADNQRVMNISRDTRQMVLDTRVPVVATMQANRKAAQNNAAELDEIAYSDAVGQDITQGFRVINEKHSPTIGLVAGGSREYRLHGLRINGVPCTDFTFHSVMTEKEIERATRDDAKSDEPDHPGAHSAARRRPRVGKDQLNKALDHHLKNI